MKLKDMLYLICIGMEDDCPNLYRSPSDTFFKCELYNKPISKKLIKQCWDEVHRHDFVKCKACGIRWHWEIDIHDKDFTTCPECGGELRPLKSFEEELIE